MKLRVRHRTTYHYPFPVRDSFNEVRLQPTQDSAQTRRAFSIKTDPRKAFSQYLDFYGNIVHYFEVAEPHHQLTIETFSEVETHQDSRGQPPTGRTLADLNPQESSESLHDFMLGSKYVDLSPEIWRAALDILPQGITDITADIALLAQWVYQNFTYEPGATQVHTTMSQSLSLRRGVCQDFAHILIGLCRSLKLPARYISGYFLNDSHRPAPDESEASHAWAEVYIPQFGWYGIDPTHNRPTDQRYIKVAAGRDYADIRPVAGTYRGPASREMHIFVRVTQA